MHTDSSASRTCRLSRSASLNTATVEISSSRQARITRSAISPRFAIRTLRNIRSRAPSLCRVPAAPATRDRLRILAAGGVHRLPQAVGGGGDALELERELVRVRAVLER